MSIILITSISILIWQRQNLQTAMIGAGRWQKKFEENQILIHQHLNHVYRQYNNGSYDEARNTFLDLKQIWQYQDVVARSIAVADYFPSDSLLPLDVLLDLPVSDIHQKMVIQEIRRINMKLSHY